MNRKKTRRRILSLILSMVLIIGIIPNSPMILVANAAEITLSGSDSYTANDGDMLTGSTTGTVTIADNASITLNDVTITGGIVCNGTATITLVGTNIVNVSNDNLEYKKAGIQIGGSGTTLTIRGNGSLTATGGSAAAGIGLGRTWDASVTAGSIVIEGGTVTASGGIGIGIGTVGNSQTAAIDGISIKGGTVNASLGKGYLYNGVTATVGYIKVYDTIDMVDASKITETVTYMHGDDDVTANKTDYFTIGEDGERRIITPKDDTDYTITIADGIENGTITAAATAKYLETVTVTATPTFGYRLSRLIVKDADNNDIATNGNTFLMPKGNVTVSAEFALGSHGTTEFTWGYDSPGSFVNEATIYDGVTTVNIQQTGAPYSIRKYDGYTYSKFQLDNDNYDANIPYDGGTGEFYETGNGTNFRLPYDGETGYYDITMTDVGNGKWSVSILKTAAIIADIPDQTYTGGAITPEPLVVAGSLDLTKGTDYEYSYSDNTNVGTATVTVTFKGDYASLGSVEKTFNILPSTIMVNVTGGGTVTIGDKSASDGEAFGVMSEKGANVTLTLTPESGNTVRSVEYGYTNSKGTNMSGSKLPISDGTATLTVPDDLKDGTGVTLIVTFASALVGGADEDSAVALTDATVTDLAGGWYKVESDITFDHTLNLLGDTHLTIASGATMTVNTASGKGIDSDYTLTVGGAGALSVTASGSNQIAVRVGNYVQTGATVTASGFIGIRCCDDFDGNVTNDFTFSGGQLTATGTSDGIRVDNTITISCTNGSDFIQSSSYDGTIKVADGKALTDGMNIYTGTLTSAQISAIAGKQLVKKTYEISFVKGDDDASGSMESETVYAETDYILPACGFTAPDGKAFDKWQIGEDTENLKSAGDTITITDNTVIKATYKKATAVINTISKVDKDGNQIEGNITGTGSYPIGSTVTFTAPKVEGYNFVGWYKHSDDSPYYTGEKLSSANTYTFTATEDADYTAVYEARGKASITVNGGSSFTVNGSTKSSQVTADYTLGSTVTVSVTADDFAYWANSYGMVLSREKTYSFTVTGADTVTAVFDTVIDNKATVIFESAYGQVMARDQLAAGDSMSIPSVPTLNGYDAIGWDMDGDGSYDAEKDTLATAIAKGFAAESKMVTIRPLYQLKETKYTISVTNGSGAGQYNQNEVVTVTADAPEAGQKFSHWKDSGDKILSYDTTYKFFAEKDMNITAVYVADTVVVEAKGTTEIINMYKDTENNKLTFVSMSTVPEGCTINKAGVIATNNETVGTSGDGFNASTAVFAVGNSWTGTAYRYTFSKGKVNTGDTWYVRAYLVYTDASGNSHTVYGDMVSQTY